MISKNQIEELSSLYKIDGFTIFREYLQLIFLNYLYQNTKADDFYFKGGTAIHLLFNSPRFSEDLDFSTQYPSGKIGSIIKDVEGQMKRELTTLSIQLLHKGKEGTRYRLKYTSPDFKYPFGIRLDVAQERPLSKNISPLLTKFPVVIFPVITHLSAEEILAEKIRAFFTRVKGRDVFDIWFLLEKGVKMDKNLIEEKFKKINQNFEMAKLLKKLEALPEDALRQDLDRFLPEPHRKIKDLVPRIKTKLAD